MQAFKKAMKANKDYDFKCTIACFDPITNANPRVSTNESAVTELKRGHLKQIFHQMSARLHFSSWFQMPAGTQWHIEATGF